MVSDAARSVMTTGIGIDPKYAARNLVILQPASARGLDDRSLSAKKIVEWHAADGESRPT